MEMSELYESMAKMVISGATEEIVKLTRQVLNEGAQPREILDKGLLPGMEVVGERFKVGDMYIPEVILSARTMHAALDVLRPLFVESDHAGFGTVIIGTVEGDIHNVGKNLVAIVLEGAGFEVVDLGVDVKPQVFVQAVKEHRPDIVAMSALLTTTIPKMAETIRALQEAGLRKQVKIMAGGAPVTEEFVMKIGGDGYAPDAVLAVEKAKVLLKSCRTLRGGP
jgi:5-methyltetrahydrofolate--homocysteine methyltransferase